MFNPVPPSPSSRSAPPQDRPPAEAAPERDEDLKAVVGANADYYLRSWRPVLAGETTLAGFNRAAFFLGGFWLAYRRMYLGAVLFYGVLVAEVALELLVFCGILGLRQPPALLGMAVGFLTAVACGGFANGWYLSHVRKVIARTRAERLPPAEYRQALAARGGTDFLGAVGVVALCLLAAALFGVFFGGLLGLA